MSKPVFLPFSHLQIKNIIFDLGGVILNIDYHLTIEAFKRMGVSNFETIFSQAHQDDLFDKLDKGLVTPQVFRDNLRQLIGINISDNLINDAWNAMLLDFPARRIDLLKTLSVSFRTFLLSNTNAIHIEEYNKILLNTFGYTNLSFLFEREYYSHLIGMRKPNRDVFIHILAENRLDAAETLFIDDSIQHVEAAQKLGIHSYHLNLPNGDAIEKLFSFE